jgi:hypothetical protein
MIICFVPIQYQLSILKKGQRWEKHLDVLTFQPAFSREIHDGTGDCLYNIESIVSTLKNSCIHNDFFYE